MNAPDDSPRRIYLLCHGHVDTGEATPHRPHRPAVQPLGTGVGPVLGRGNCPDAGATRILASDLCRALDTAHIIAANLGLDVVVEPALREIDLGA